MGAGERRQPGAIAHRKGQVRKSRGSKQAWDRQQRRRTDLVAVKVRHAPPKISCAL